MEAFEEAREAARRRRRAREARDLVERRIDALRQLMGKQLVKHSRHYTLEEANAALGWVQDVIASLRSAREGLSDEEAREALAEAGRRTAAATRARRLGGVSPAARSVAQLQEAEVVLRDLDRGLVDFPAIRDEREVYLCWLEGEDEIGYWHDLEAGFAGREPL